MMMALEGYIDPMPIGNPQTASVMGGLYRLRWGLQGFFSLISRGLITLMCLCKLQIAL